jgi:hypothetical protein
MKTHKKEYKQVIDKIYCDMCGSCCTDDNFGTECANLEAVWGYLSSKDGSKFDIQLCERCFDDVLEWIKNQRKSYLGPFKYPYQKDPLSGESNKI